MKTAFLLFLSLGACGQNPLGQIQFCLTEQNSRLKLAHELQAIGRDEGLDYFDWSEPTGKQLQSLDASKFRNIQQSFPVLNVGIRRRDGLGLGGGNIGFPTGQVRFGFTAGRDRKEALAFMRRALVRLGRTWDVHEVSGEKGAFQLDCSQIKSP